MKKINFIFFLCFLSQLLCGQTDTTIYITPEKFPAFPGGMDSLLRYLHRNIIYPPIDRDASTGTIHVEFVVEMNGRVTNAKILKGLHPIYDKEVLRVINSLPDWATPGYKNNVAVRTRMVIPIRIHLR